MTLRLAHAAVIVIKIAVRLVALSCTLLEKAQAITTDLQTLQVGLCPLCRRSSAFSFACTSSIAGTIAPAVASVTSITIATAASIARRWLAR